MKFTMEREALIKLVQLAGQKKPKQKRAEKLVKLTACSARVFAEANSTTAGIEALVLQDGSCLLDRKIFVAILKTYTNKEHLTFEAGPNWIKFGATIMNTAGYSTKAEPPGEFQVFPVRDTWITRFAMA